MTNPEELAELNRRIAVCKGWECVIPDYGGVDVFLEERGPYSPATRWADAGPLLEELAAKGDVDLYWEGDIWRCQPLWEDEPGDLMGVGIIPTEAISHAWLAVFGEQKGTNDDTD